MVAPLREQPESPISEPESPLFEPEGPVVLKVDDVVAHTQEPEQFDDTRISCSIKLLRSIEQKAKEQMETWEPHHRRQSTTEKGLGTSAGTKRKASAMDTEPEHTNTDSESDDEDDDKVKPHDPDQQLRPKLPIYHPGFALAEGVTKEVLGVFTSYITTALNEGYEDAEAKRLRDEIEESQKIRYQETIKLAVAGDTGAGKSALLNAILGVVNLNIESDAGGACTCVITEFRQSPPAQGTPFAAEVEFFDLTLCLTLVTDFFRSWFDVKKKQKHSPDDLDDADANRVKTARDCMQQMFAECLGHEDIESFMSTAKSSSDGKVVGQLRNWTTRIRQKFVEDSGTSVCFGSNTPEQLIEHYHPFTREVPNASFMGKPLRFTPWPLVRIVRISLTSPILKQNVTVADVPGVSDINYFRLENARRYLQECDMTIVVGKIDRLQDNSSFQQQYMDAFRRRRSNSVILVATRSDDLNEENNSTSTLDNTAQEQLAAVDQKVADYQLEIARIDEKLDKCLKKEKKQIRKKKTKLMSLKNAVAKQRKNILISSRNNQVSHVISGNYRSDTNDDAGTAVYCVSNRMYMRHLRGYDKSDEQTIPTMTPEQTQIPDLCSHIYALPSKGKTASLNHFVSNSTPTLLNIIQMSCSTTTLARADHLSGIVRNARKTLEDRMQALTKKFRTTDIKSLYDALAHHSLQSKFDIHANKNLTIWESLNPASHRAAMNKKGNYVQKKKGIKLAWDEDLLAPVRPLIDVPFRKIIDESVETYGAEVAQASKEVLNDLDKTLMNDPKALACDAYKVCFKNSLSGHCESVSLDVDKAVASLKTDLIQAHLYATSAGEEGYFPDAMNDIYSAAYLVKSTGKGVTMFEARKTYLRRNIPGPTGPFCQISGWAKKDAEDAIAKASTQLGKKLDDNLLKVQNAFERMKMNKDNDTPEGILFRHDLQTLVKEARSVMQGVVQENLDLCKQFK